MTRGPARRAPAERFWPKVAVAGPDDCWLWTAGQHKAVGYGRFGWAPGDVRYAHRVSWELTRGPVPHGMQIDHLCRVRLCVNPNHLEPVPQRENLLRGEGWAGRNSRKTHCPQGHEYTTENILRHHGRRECRRCDLNRSARRRARIKHGAQHA